MRLEILDPPGRLAAYRADPVRVIDLPFYHGFLQGVIASVII